MNDETESDDLPEIDDLPTESLALETAKYGTATSAAWGGIHIAGDIWGTPLPPLVGAVGMVVMIASLVTMLLTAMHARPLLNRMMLWWSTREYQPE